MKKTIVLLIAFLPNVIYCNAFDFKHKAVSQDKNITLKAESIIHIKSKSIRATKKEILGGKGRLRNSSELLKYFDFTNGYSIWSDDPLFETVRFTPSQYPCVIDSIILVAYIYRGIPSIPDTVFIRDDDSGTSIPGTILSSFTYFCSGGNGTIDTVTISTGGSDTIKSGDFWVEYRTISEAQNSILLMSDKNNPTDNINYWSTDRQTWNLDNVNEPLAAYVTYIENAQIEFDRDTIKIVYPQNRNQTDASRAGLDSICYHSIEIDSTASYFTNLNLYSAVRFTPPQYPITIESTLVYLYATYPGNFEDTLFLWKNNSGNPGNLIKTIIWNDSFLSSGVYGLYIPINETFYSGSYWLGTVSVTNEAGDSLLLCSDTTTQDNSGRNYYSWDRQNWTLLGSNYGDWGITSYYRYSGTDSGMFYIINPSTSTADLYVSDIFPYNNSSWILDISPTAMTLSPGDSAPVYINIDTFALPSDNYIDSLEIISNASKARNSKCIPILLDYNTATHSGLINEKFDNPKQGNIISNKICNKKLNLTKEVINAKNTSATIFDLGGKMIYNKKTLSRGYIDLKKFPAGIYFIRLNINGISYADKFVKIQ